MIVLFDVWCAFSPRIRVVCWASWVAVLSALAMFFLHFPGRGDDDALNLQRAANHQIKPTLYHLSGVLTESQVSSTSQTSPFSPLSLQVPNVQLLHWQPSAQGGELAVKAPWEAVVSLFGYLATRGMSVSGFSLKAENDERVLTLTLESFHEG
ncbi:TPA: DNA utilization protein HofO [Citrobacter amalonaticus]|uniref:HofO family protein n=1 Tax=Citrobacter sp. Ct235 TaxID=2985157 RepID=UPI002574F50F|nr:DNA utilization protein HofO [Citrobacter sp. Ct235]EKZ2525629.1 DNA utilization protein HofO [Citrobacter farmeri]MDM2735130.1 DNA utilization protein HofO [Citrobacter sp. Ct235]HCL6627131.1 DNA utilization protein HofO [Citrobacter amalonaticus]